MQIKNFSGLTMGQLHDELIAGGKFVTYQYCVSILFMTFRPPTDVYFIRSGQSAAVRSLPFTLITLLFGWWGIPWGPVHTIDTLICNLKGGKDITEFVSEMLLTQQPVAKQVIINQLSTAAA